VNGGFFFRLPGKVGFDLVGNVEGLVGQAEALAGGFGELGSSFAVGLGGAFHLRDAFSNQGFAGDELGMAVSGGLGLFEHVGKDLHVLGVDLIGFETVGFEALAGVLALRFGGHGIESDAVVVVEEDEVIESEVSGEGGGLGGDPFLQAPVAGQADDVLVENLMVLRVVAGGGHFAGDGEADRVADTLSEGAGGAFDSRGVSEFRVPRGLTAHLAEVADFLDGEVEAAQVEPAVEEHATMAGREDETIPVQPAGRLRIEGKPFAEKIGADFGGPEGKSEVAGAASVDGVDGEAAGLGCCCGENVVVNRHGMVFV